MSGVEEITPESPRRWQRHPWAEWFALGKFRLVRGEHYSCRTDSMAQIVRAKAKQLQVRVAVRIADAGDQLEVFVED